ncbi:MAG: type II toxin-antitoxin system death-on-curing family toxin [Candidatus Saccharibacteria bacterium]|nr:type II toxin-antitoxin system death-on-curing family toxin [Candidatus Saccharibacteria bacterium]
MRFLTLAHILQLHALVTVKFGGASTVRDIGRLEAVVATQHQEVFGRELYPTLHEKAAALLRGIIADHPFVDGNKRTAMLASMVFLELNGQRIVARKGEIEDFAVIVATNRPSVADIAQWLRRHTEVV